MNEANTLGSDILICYLQAPLSLMFKALNTRSHFTFPVLGLFTFSCPFIPRRLLQTLLLAVQLKFLF